MKRLVKVALFAAVIGGLVVVARKLMGGLGPQPGTPDAPKAWPSLVPEPPTPEAAAGNGAASSDPAGQPAGGAGTAGAADAAATADTPTTSEHIAPTEDSGSNS